MATGVVSMAAVPPSAVHSVSGPPNASPHILSKHAATATALTHAHPQLHVDRPAERHVDRSAERQTDRPTERQAELLLQLDRQLERQGQISSSSSSCSVAPPSGATVSLRPTSPPLPMQTSGTWTRKHFIWKLAVHLINYSSILCFNFFFRQSSRYSQTKPAPRQDLSEGEGHPGQYPCGKLRRGRPRKREGAGEGQGAGQRARQGEGERSRGRWPFLL